MTIQKGRPSNLEGREAKEICTYDFLDALGVEYRQMDHQPAMTMDVCADIDSALGASMCKNLFLCNRQKTDFYLLMMPGDKPFKTKDLSAQIGSARLSFADAESMERYLDITPGSVSVFGLMNDHTQAVRLLIDEALLKSEFIGCHPCVNTSSVRISTACLMGTVIPALKHSVTIVKL